MVSSTTCVFGAVSVVAGGGIRGGIDSIFNSQYLGMTVMAIASTSDPIHPALRFKNSISGHQYKSAPTPKEAENRCPPGLCTTNRERHTKSTRTDTEGTNNLLP